MKAITTKKNRKGRIINPAEGEKIHAPGIDCTFKITSEDSDNKIAIYELTLQPGHEAVQLHFHKQINETFIVTKGILTVQIDDEQIEAGKGSIIHIPSLVNHAFRNNSDSEVKVLLVFTPAVGREVFFRELYQMLSGKNHSGISELNAKYDTYPGNKR
jgi:quercetin dioxygenase-like cupin family protein